MMAPRTKKPAAEAVAATAPSSLPAAPNVSDEARAGIQKITTELAEFDKVEAGLQELEKTYTNVVYDCANSKGMKEAVAARQAINKPRFAVEHARKNAKAPLVKLGKDIDGRAQAITARLLAIETPIDDQIKAAERAEAARKQRHHDALEQIRSTPDQAIGKSVGELEILVESLSNMPLEAYEEFAEQATRARDAALSKVELLLANAKQAEELRVMRQREADEKARKDAIQERIGEIRGLLTTAGMARTAARVAPLLERAKAVVIDESFAEFEATALDAKTATISGLQSLYDTKVLAEKDAADAQALAAAQAQEDVAPAPSPATAPHPVGAAAAEPPAPAPTPAAAPSVLVVGGTTRRASFGFGGATRSGSIVDAEITRPVPSPKPVSAPVAIELLADRPTDAEILAVLAGHYDTDPEIVAGWLAKFDARTALAQQELPI
ncbi:MAG: hypothetical protein KF686_03580 [Ramlibacter sp.]|nr:hypothetical protein [Ramlibacter sp.]